MKFIVLDQPDRVGSWVMGQQGSRWFPGRGTAIGLMGHSGKLDAGVVYEGWNGASLQIHVAAVSGSHWMTRSYLHTVFEYPFLQLGARKLFGLVAESNLAAQRLDEHLGFQLEATLTNAHPDGALLVYSMTRETCPWTRDENGKTLRSARTRLRSSRNRTGTSEPANVGGE